MIERIDPAFKNDIRYNINHDIRFYFNPRNKEYLPYHVNTLFFEQDKDNLIIPGGAYLHTGTAIYNIQRDSGYDIFLDMLVRPTIAYNANSTILEIASRKLTDYVRLGYGTVTASKFCVDDSSGTMNLETATAFTMDSESKNWHRISMRVIANSGNVDLYYNGAKVSGTASLSSNMLPMVLTLYAGSFQFAYLRIFSYQSANYTFAQADIDNNFKDVNQEEIYFDFNGNGIGRERWNITNYVLSYGLEKSKLSADGGTSSNNLSLQLKSLSGEFADDQYAAFDPATGSYNGLISQKYLTNSLYFWMEHVYSRTVLSNYKMQALYSFEENQGLKFFDSFGGDKYGVWNSLSAWSIGKYGRCGQLSTSDYGSVSSLITGAQTALTVSAWIYLSSYGGASECRAILQNWNTNSVGSQDGFALRFLNTSAYPEFIVCDGTDEHTVTSSVAVSLNTWTHVLGEFEAGGSGRLKIYVDNVLAGTQATLPTQYSPDTVFYFGYGAVGNGKFDGKIDECFFATRILSDGERTAIYNCKYTQSIFDCGFFGRTNAGAFNRISSVADITTVSIDIADPYCQANNTTVEKSKVIEDYQLSCNIKNHMTLDTDYTTNLQLFYKFDDNTGTSAVDSSGNSRTGTLSGATWIEGLRKYCLLFDGVNDYVSAAHAANLAPTSALTVSLWAYNDTWSSSAGALISKGNPGYIMDCGYSVASYFSFTVYRGSAISVKFLLADLRPGWHHFLGVYTGQWVYLYIDNVLRDKYNFGSAGSLSYSFANSLIIGARSGSTTSPSGNYFSGKIDEVKVFNAALSRDNIEYQHNIGSLFHKIAGYAFNIKYKNYLANSGFENTTITNSWANGVRSNTFALVGTYSNAPASGATGSFQWVNFINPIPQNTKFTFFVWVYNNSTAQNVTIKLGESTSVGGSVTETSFVEATGVGWKRYSVTHTTVSKLSTALKATVSHAGGTVYYDMAHLIKGGEALNSYILNTADGGGGANPTVLYTSAVELDQRSIGIFGDLVPFSHIYAVVEEGYPLKKYFDMLSLACLANYIGCMSDGRLILQAELGQGNRYANEQEIESASQVATNLEYGYNKILIKGAAYQKLSKPEEVWNLKASGFRNYATTGGYEYPVISGASFPEEQLHGELWAEYKEFKA